MSPTARGDRADHRTDGSYWGQFNEESPAPYDEMHIRHADRCGGHGNNAVATGTNARRCTWNRASPRYVSRYTRRSPNTSKMSSLLSRKSVRLALMLATSFVAAGGATRIAQAQNPDSLVRRDSTAAQPTTPVAEPSPIADSTADSSRKKAPSARKPTRKKAAASSATAAAKPARPAPVWPVAGPAPLPGAILPRQRILAYYGNPLSKRMGILGEIAPDSMLARLDREVAAWNAADSTTKVKPALHLIAVVAQAGPGPGGKYRLRMTDTLIARVASWAETRNALVFLDVQVGLSTLQDELPALRKWLERPNFHLGIDPEFAMTKGGIPGKRIGTFDAEHINYAIDWLAGITEEKKLPPKVLVVHRFTRPMVTNHDKIKLDPRVQVVIQMDGWGPPSQKIDSYQSYVWREPVQYTGFKLFYKNDRKGTSRLMTPEEVLKLKPAPLYIQYQ